MRLLCLSNGHGEDEIAVRILRELQQTASDLEVAALPIVGEGHAYAQLGVPLIGSVKTMPSGGFIYMDGRQFARDLRGGLLQLTLAQIQAVRQWVGSFECSVLNFELNSELSADLSSDLNNPTQTPNSKTQNSKFNSSSSFILAVGDIVPLLFAWLSGLPFAFVGTAKSEYYLRDERGFLPRRSWWDDRLQRWTGCVYHPWERWLMSRPNCKAVFPRDRLTADILRRFAIPAFDLGNPMMDGLGWQGEHSHLKADPTAALTIVLLPGSRPPEAYANWEMILLALNHLLAELPRSLRFLVAIAPTLDWEILRQILRQFRWQQTDQATYTIGVGERKTTLTLMPPQHFNECIHRADLAIAMAGTATEQFVGLGKPAVSIPGAGPQFTAKFAEAQTRLLGASVTLVETPSQTATAIQALLQDPDRLHWIAENGVRRMGPPGAAQRIATCLLEQFS